MARLTAAIATARNPKFPECIEYIPYFLWEWWLAEFDEDAVGGLWVQKGDEIPVSPRRGRLSINRTPALRSSCELRLDIFDAIGGMVQSSGRFAAKASDR